MPDFLKKMTPSEVGRLGALARQGKYKAKKRDPKGRRKAATPEEAAAAREAKRRQEASDKRAEVMASFGSFGRQTLPDLEALASGGEIPAENADGMVMAGLAERLSTGAVVLTANGKRLYNAASRGDVGKAKEAIDRAEAAAGERIARDKAAAEEGTEAEEQPKGGGGGGGGKEKPSADDKAKTKAEERARTAVATAERVGLEPATLDTLRAAAEDGSAPDDNLVTLGLQDASGDATDQGRRALVALERGDVRQYRAALQDARARIERGTATQAAAFERAIAQIDAAAAREAAANERQAKRDAAASTRRTRMDRAEALRVLGETQKALALKHGAHDQSTHGRRGPRGRASAGAYRAARAGGASVQEARAAARDVSAVYTNQQRIANIDKQLGGHVSAGRRDSLRAERARLEADTLARIDRTTAAVVGASSMPPTVRGRPAPTPKPGASGSSAGASGNETRAYGANPNQSYTMQHRVVDMDAIQASNTANGGINPKYDPALQPRDRSRAASQAQIDEVARRMNPDVLATDFHRIDAGSPIIDSDGNVLSGNGRTLALQRAAALYPEQYAAYKQRIKDEADALGIDPKAIDGMRTPVLVRELKGDADPIAFAREANSSGTLRMSPLEQAKVDAQVLTDKNMLRLNVADGADIDRALRAKDNKPFIDDFLKTVPENERATLLTRNGELNQAGLYRIKAAVYTKAFPGEAGERMAESMLESLDPDIKTVQNGISAALPAFSRAVSLTRSGQRDKDLDLSEDVAKVVDVYARIKDTPSLTANTPADKVVRKYLDQTTMFDRELSPQQERILVHLDSISRRPTAVRDFLSRYAGIVEGQPPPGQVSLFGDAGKLTRDQLLDTLIGTPGGSAGPGMFGQPQPTQPGMFV